MEQETQPHRQQRDFGLEKEDIMGLLRIHFLSDALEVIEGVNRAEDWSIYQQILDIDNFVSHFDKTQFSHVS